VSRTFEWHPAKVTRIEAARVAVTPRDVRDLLILYGVDDDNYREMLIRIARSARERSWWADYRDVLPAGSFIPLEADASVMRNWEPAVVPGLLQTEAYMRALFSTADSETPRAGIDRVVSLRLTRQHRLTGDLPLSLHTIVDESVIYRQIGGPGVMAEQLRHLIEVSELPTVDLRILPYSAGEHPLLGTAVAILEFQDAPDLDIVYVEQFRGTHHLVKRPIDVSQCRARFERLAAKSLDTRRTRNLMKATIDQY
jgi:hypothetical protein